MCRVEGVVHNRRGDLFCHLTGEMDKRIFIVSAGAIVVCAIALREMHRIDELNRRFVERLDAIDITSIARREGSGSSARVYAVAVETVQYMLKTEANAGYKRLVQQMSVLVASYLRAEPGAWRGLVERGAGVFGLEDGVSDLDIESGLRWLLKMGRVRLAEVVDKCSRTCAAERWKRLRHRVFEDESGCAVSQSTAVGMLREERGFSLKRHYREISVYEAVVEKLFYAGEPRLSESELYDAFVLDLVVMSLAGNGTIPSMQHG
jgi:hypothetical protein